MQPENERLSHDLLIGGRAIADYTGMDVHAVYHAAAMGHLPIFKIGPKVAARKSQLDRALSAPSDREGA